MLSRTSRRSLAAFCVVAIAAAACSSGDSALQSGEGGGETNPPDTSTDSTDPTESTQPETSDAGATPTEPAATEPPAPTTTEAPLAQYPPCPVDALDELAVAGDPIEVVFWHGMANEPESALIERTDAYNASQEEVRVKLQNQTSYESAIDKYIQVGQKSRPDLIQLPEYSLQVFAQSDTFVPVGACIEADAFDTSPFLPRALSAYQFEGVQWSMPFNVSDPILYLNRKTFEAAGLDPDDPPITLDELRATSEQIVESGAASFGLVLDSGADSGGGWYLEQWFGRVGEPYADNGNGRLAPATEVLFDSQVGVDMLTFLQEMIEDGLAVSVGDNPGGQDTFLKMIDPAEAGAMTIGTSAALGSVIAALGSGLAPGLTTDDIGVGPMPGPSPEPSAQVGGASLWIPADKGDATTAAAWDYITFLTTAESQSIWSSATGYVPVREDAIEIEPLASTYAQDPRFAVPYTQLLFRADDITANAPVLGPQREVRAETARATAAIFGGSDVATELAKAAERSNALIQSYNSRN